MRGLVRGHLDGGVEQRLVLDDGLGLDTARRGDDDLRLRIVQPHGELVRGEPAEHNRMDRAEPSRREHRHRDLGHHRHVDHNAIALGDTEPGERSREDLHLVEQLGVGHRALGARDRAVIDDRRLRTTPRFHVAIDAVVGCVALRTREPAAILSAARVEDLVGRPEPVDRLGRFPPESLGIGQPSVIDVPISAHLPASFLTAPRSRFPAPGCWYHKLS